MGRLLLCVYYLIIIQNFVSQLLLQLRGSFPKGRSIEMKAATQGMHKMQHATSRPLSLDRAVDTRQRPALPRMWGSVADCLYR